MDASAFSTHSFVRFPEVPSSSHISLRPTLNERSASYRHISNVSFGVLQRFKLPCSNSMNGCYRVSGSSCSPIGTIETLTLPAVNSHGSAIDRLNSSISELKANPPSPRSGILRLQVPIKQHIEAIDWLHAQQHNLLPRCFFSGRRSRYRGIADSAIGGANGSDNHLAVNGYSQSLISVAGIGSAVLFRQLHPFSYRDWKSIKRFLSSACPLIRAYGAIRFDARANTSTEWKDFGSFYFVIPQVEFDEFEGSSMLAVTIAWDNDLLWTWENAVNSLQDTMDQLSLVILRLRKEVTGTLIVSSNHSPDKLMWDFGVKRALQIINRSSSPLEKVVLARSSKVVTASELDPVALLACLQVFGCATTLCDVCLNISAISCYWLQPEQLFHRRGTSVSSEALAGTRARGNSLATDLDIELDLLSSPKDHLEFTIVRDSIKRKLEAVCSSILIEPKKAIRKFSRVQHLYAQLAGDLRSEDDEFDILSSLHPTPAVCGFPTQDALRLIAETEVFDRGMYAGPVGWFGGGESEFSVGIRSALVEKGLGAMIYAGTGIVEGSDPSSEWLELELKTSQFTKLLKLETQQRHDIQTLGRIRML